MVQPNLSSAGARMMNKQASVLSISDFFNLDEKMNLQLISKRVYKIFEYIMFEAIIVSEEELIQ